MATLTSRAGVAGGAAPAASPCALCDDAVTPEDGGVSCPACGAAYHTECWGAIGHKCARLGCPGWSEPAPTAVAVPSRTVSGPREIVLDGRDVAGVEPQKSPTQSDDLVTGCWATPLQAALTGGLGGLYLDLVFSLTERALLWEMGAHRLHEMLSLQALATCNRASWWLWMLAGAVYGVLHRRYLAGKLRTFYPPLRLVLAVALLGSLSLGLGHLTFLLTYRSPGSFWGLPGALAWMPPYFAWVLLGVAVGRALAGYTLPLDLFEMVTYLWGLTLGLALNATATALAQGGIMHGLGWLAGRGLDELVSGHHLAARIAGALGCWFANVGFIVAALQSGPNLARQLRERTSR
jgi:hypothetical protein